jgi:hypothetical protein
VICTLFAKYNWNKSVEEDEVGRSYSTNGGRVTPIGYLWESRERDYKENKDVGEWIILGWILERLDGVMWTGLVCAFVCVVLCVGKGFETG